MTRFTYMVVRKGRLYTPACRLAHQRFKIKVSKKHFVRSWFLGWVSRISHTQGLQVDGSPATEGPVHAAQSSPTPRLGTNTHTHTYTHLYQSYRTNHLCPAPAQVSWVKRQVARFRTVQAVCDLQTLRTGLPPPPILRCPDETIWRVESRRALVSPVLLLLDFFCLLLKSQ